MKTAVCEINNKVYEAAVFEQDRHFENIKNAMVCPECNGPAFFRGITLNGREACFGARHAEGCTLATSEQDEMQADNGSVIQRIVVDFNPDSTAPGSLNSLLGNLMTSEEFRISTDVIEVPEHGEFVMADFFVNFADIADEHVGAFKGFWGVIPDVRVSGNTMWMNVGGPGTPCVNLDEEHFQTVYQRFQVQEATELSGSHILVCGELKVSRTKNKKFILISNPDNFTLILPPRS